jgi:CRISP-associated protein Cas1
MPIIEDLIVSDYGASVGLVGRRIRVSVPEAKPTDAPLMHLKSVQILTRAANISAAALAACCEAGIPVHIIDSVQGAVASVISPALTSVVTSRRCQIEAAYNAIGIETARQIGLGKIRSQITNLRYLVRRADDETAEKLHIAALDLTDHLAKLEKLEAETLDDVRAVMMGIEGYSTRIYWGAWSSLLPEHYAWTGRTGRHATDKINSLLNYGYGILYGEVQNALVIAGLEPHVGLLHTDRPGKPSLTLDLIEEFRAPIVDRTVIGLARRNFVVEQTDDGRMTRETRKAYAEHILSRLNAQGVYDKKRYSLRAIIQLQARKLAAAFRDECGYIAYSGG